MFIMGKKAIRLTLGFLAFMWLVWCTPLVFHFILGFSWNPGKMAEWGDSFGALNALFAAVAAAGVLITFRQQADELKRQQRRITMQNRRLEIAEFEASYFQLLKLSQDLRSSATFRNDNLVGSSGEGREAFEVAAAYMINLLGTFSLPHGAGNFRQWLASVYEKDVHPYGANSLEPYFRVLYTILRRLYEFEALNSKEKARYGNLLRSQLSSAEVSLIAANALTDASNDFSDYVIEFRLLKYLPEDRFKHSLRTVYPEQAFAQRDEVKRRIKLLM